MFDRSSPARPQMFATRHGLDEDTRRSMVIMLNQRLADMIDLHAQTKHAHWNVKGMSFFGLHRLFDELAATTEKSADLVAERATALGGTAYGTVRMVAEGSSLPEFPAKLESDTAFVETLVDRYADTARRVGDGIDRALEAGDKGTADLLTQVARELDQGVYLLESHLQTPR